MANRMTNLTPKQLHFCRCVVSGCTMSDAYREAYNTSKMKPATVNREAHTLMTDPKIATRVERLQRAKDRAVVASSLSDRERVLNVLRDLLENATGAAGEASMLRAADLLGKSVGLYKDVVITQPVRTSEEIEAELEERLAAAEDEMKSVH